MLFFKDFFFLLSLSTITWQISFSRLTSINNMKYKRAYMLQSLMYGNFICVEMRFDDDTESNVIRKCNKEERRIRKAIWEK